MRHERSVLMTLQSFKRRTRAAVLLATAVLVAASAYVALAKDGDSDNGRGPAAYTIALFGDMPYNALGRSQYPSLLADINRSHVNFSVFDGDLKSGGDGSCSNSLYTTAIDDFNTLERPLVWLPGDNDWTD